jgi:hypothetical protein
MTELRNLNETLGTLIILNQSVRINKVHLHSNTNWLLHETALIFLCHTYIHTYMHAYTHTYVRNTQTYIHTDLCILKHIHILVHTNIHTHTNIGLHAHTHTHIYIYMCVCVCVCKPIYIYIHTHTHRLTYTYIYYIHTHAYIKKVKQSLYTPWRRLGGEEV